MIGTGHAPARFQRMTVASLALLLVAGCGRELRTNNEIGRWQIVPVGGGGSPPASGAGWSAWRVDTETGQTELCSYLAGPPTVSNPPQGAGYLKCTAPVEAAGPNDLAYNSKTGKLERPPQPRKGWRVLGVDLDLPAVRQNRLPAGRAGGEAPIDVRHLTNAQLMAGLDDSPAPLAGKSARVIGVEDYPASLRPMQPPPKPGSIEDGYRFIGGDPSSAKSWTKLQTPSP